MYYCLSCFMASRNVLFALKMLSFLGEFASGHYTGALLLDLLEFLVPRPVVESATMSDGLLAMPMVFTLICFAHVCGGCFWGKLYENKDRQRHVYTVSSRNASH